MGEEPEKSMEEVIRTDGRYPPEAYAFLHEGLSLASKKVHGEQAASGQRHVTGQQICEALRELAIERYGHLARAVLAKWRINETMDFGNMVYLLIENKFMKKTPEDSIEDFRDVFDLDTALAVGDDFDLKE
ncbi:MAG: Minf_1886 family protein [Phycisphaerae bacterium]